MMDDNSGCKRLRVVFGVDIKLASRVPQSES